MTDSLFPYFNYYCSTFSLFSFKKYFVINSPFWNNLNMSSMLCRVCTQWTTRTGIGVPETLQLSNVQGDHQAYSWSNLNIVPLAVAWREIRIFHTLAIFHNWKVLKVRITFLCQYLRSTFNFIGRSVLYLI